MEKLKTEIKWGCIFTAVMLIWMAFERMMGWHGEQIEQHAMMSMIFAVFAVGIYILALLDKRNNHLNGSMTWSQGFVSGFWITMVVVVLSPLAQLLTHTIITPDFFDNMSAYATESGMMSRKDAASYFSLKSYLIQSTGGALALGIVTSAIVAIFTKKKDQQ
ncbi:DUF4199 domain-containing protein [Rhodohalobacter sp. 8-1]|uniref:DUF4199 domain-containing protein n=1 Tax=Rhodohalobacter sp. 8-1 TaxID=3131972 RepID=UPI0030EBCF6C